MIHPEEWGLDPLYWSFVKLTIYDLQNRVKKENFAGLVADCSTISLVRIDVLTPTGSFSFSLFNHPISRIEICGVVVFRNVYEQRAVYAGFGVSVLAACPRIHLFVLKLMMERV